MDCRVSYSWKIQFSHLETKLLKNQKKVHRIHLLIQSCTFGKLAHELRTWPSFVARNCFEPLGRQGSWACNWREKLKAATAKASHSTVIYLMVKIANVFTVAFFSLLFLLQSTVFKDRLDYGSWAMCPAQDGLGTWPKNVPLQLHHRMPSNHLDSNNIQLNPCNTQDKLLFDPTQWTHCMRCIKR